jgi:hypothetical protein
MSVVFTSCSMMVACHRGGLASGEGGIQSKEVRQGDREKPMKVVIRGGGPFGKKLRVRQRDISQIPPSCQSVQVRIACAVPRLLLSALGWEGGHSGVE